MTDQPNTNVTTYKNSLDLITSQLGEDLANTDFQTARTNLRNLIADGETALKELLELSTVSQDPEAYGALASIMKTLVGANRQLLDLHRLLQDTKKKELELPVTHIHNSNVIVLTPKELHKILKNAENEPKIIDITDDE